MPCFRSSLFSRFPEGGAWFWAPRRIKESSVDPPRANAALVYGMGKAYSKAPRRIWLCLFSLFATPPCPLGFLNFSVNCHLAWRRGNGWDFFPSRAKKGERHSTVDPEALDPLMDKYWELWLATRIAPVAVFDRWCRSEWCRSVAVRNGIGNCGLHVGSRRSTSGMAPHSFVGRTMRF